MKKFKQDLLAIDIETTGLDPIKYSVCEIGVVLIDKYSLEILDKFGTYVKPFVIYDDDEEKRTQLIHNITKDMMEVSPDFVTVAHDIENWVGDTKSVLPAAWGTHFDINYMQAQYKKINEAWPYTYRCFDIKSAVYWELYNREINPKSSGVKGTCDALGIEFRGTRHSALDDIINAVRILNYLKR